MSNKTCPSSLFLTKPCGGHVLIQDLQQRFVWSGPNHEPRQAIHLLLKLPKGPRKDMFVVLKTPQHTVCGFLDADGIRRHCQSRGSYDSAAAC